LFSTIQSCLLLEIGKTHYDIARIDEVVNVEGQFSDPAGCLGGYRSLVDRLNATVPDPLSRGVLKADRGRFKWHCPVSGCGDSQSRQNCGESNHVRDR
jgi:hypothetical protein